MTAWQPAASLETLRLRAAWLTQIRSFFAARKVLEVETPILSAATIPDPHIHSLETVVNGRRQYLQTSPELYMKRLVAAGSGAIYQISRAFRDDECGRWHHPEFTLVEWYQPGYTQQQLMREVADLVTSLCAPERTLTPMQPVAYRQLFKQSTGVDPLQPDWRHFRARCQSLRVRCPLVDDEDWDAAMDWLFATIVQSTMQGLVFVTDYPATQASLARLAPDNAQVARRFELFIDGLEIANGFEELTDEQEQRRRFESENEKRRRQNLPPVALDELFLDALAAGLPPTAGVALGLERLLMWASGSERITDVMSFASTPD